MRPLSTDHILPVARKGCAPLVESYFVKATNPHRREALWLKFTFLVTAQAERNRASVWAIHFDGPSGRKRAFKRTWHLEDVEWPHERLDLALDGCTLRPGRTRGRIQDEQGGIEWDLTFEDPGPPILLYPPLLMRAPLPRFKLATPMPDSRFRGSFGIDGRTSSADGFAGMLGHNWGPKHTPLYAWAHANLFDGESECVFEGACGRIRVAGMDTPMLTTLTLRHHGRHYDLHSVASFGGRRSDLSNYRWFFSVREPPVRIEGVVQTVRDDLVGLYYDNPDGTMTYCLNSKIAHVRLFLYEDGCASVRLDSRCAAFEMGTTDPHHGVDMVI